MAKQMNRLLASGMTVLALTSAWAQCCRADAAGDYVRQANKLYTAEQYTAAIDKYDEALVERPSAQEPKFNKANSFYRLDDLGKALDLYREVAAESKDMQLVTRAKYNLGNTHFQQGMKQRDSDMQKAIEQLETGIDYWRQVLDIDPENTRAAKNIEVARLIIKDIIDQLNKQKQEQEQNQQDQQNQQQQQQNQQGQNQDQQQDPNEPQDQKQDPNEPQDPNQSQEQQQQAAPDTTAEDILDKEKRERKERQILQRGGYQKVEKDW